jgi:hypothetical protein
MLHFILHLTYSIISALHRRATAFSVLVSADNLTIISLPSNTEVGWPLLK